MTPVRLHRIFAYSLIAVLFFICIILSIRIQDLTNRASWQDAGLQTLEDRVSELEEFHIEATETGKEEGG